jgi:hypothetical protein
VSFDIDQANQKFNTFFEEVKKTSVQLNDDDDKKMRYKSLAVLPFRFQSPLDQMIRHKKVAK